MKAYLDEQYLKLLNDFINRKIEIVSSGDDLEIAFDPEIHYLLVKKAASCYKFQTFERGQIIRSTEYFSELEMKRKLALSLKGLFGPGINYSQTSLFRQIKQGDIVELKSQMNKFVGEEYYSINNPEIWKVNLDNELKNDTYNIYILLSDNSELYVQKNLKPERAYSRLYNESLYFKVKLRRIRDYQEVFDDNLTKGEIEQLFR